MLVNHLKFAVRRARRRPGSTAIKIFGLSVGLTFCTLVLLYVRQELTYDQFHERADRIYRIVATSFNPEGDFYRTRVPPPVGPALVGDFSQIQESVRTAPATDATITVGSDSYPDSGILLTDRSFLEVFSFPLIAGDAASALSAPGSAVLTASTAEKYFGHTDVIGETLILNNSIPLTVEAVAAEPPTNSSIQFSMLVSVHTAGAGSSGWLDNWGSSTTSTYLLLAPGADPEDIREPLTRFVDARMGESLDEEERYVLDLQQLRDVHLHPHVPPEEAWSASNLRYVYLFSILGALILLIACINYVNLETAQGLGRAPEVGVRKVLGSDRGMLMVQFLGESFLFVVTAFLLTILFVKIALPGFNDLTASSLTLSDAFDPIVLGGMLVLCGLLGVSSGFYPALYVSRFRPADAIRGHASERDGGRSRARKRNLLVASQFVAAVLLIVWTSTVSGQLDFMLTKDLGFDADQVLVVPLRDPAAVQGADIMKSEWLEIPGVRMATLSSEVPGDVRMSSTATWEGATAEEGLEVNHIMVDFDFVDLMELDLVGGRSFSRATPGDSSSAYVLNEAAVRKIGWQDPIGKRFTIWGREAPVIGVVKDFHFASLRESVGPLALHFGPRMYRTASLRTDAEDIGDTIEQVQRVFERFVPGRPFEFHFLDESVDELYRSEQRFSRLSQYLTLIALFLACLGLFGLTASIVEQRTREIGIRKILGASSLEILTRLTGELVRPVVIALLIASPVAWIAANRWLATFAYRMEMGPGVFLSSATIVLIVSVVTVGYQSFRTAQADPVDTLRHH